MKQFNFWIDWGTGQITVEADTEDEARDWAYEEVMNNPKEYMPYIDFTFDLKDEEKIMNNRTTDYCINFLKARGVACFRQDELLALGGSHTDVIVVVEDVELVLSQAEINYRAELWLESELQGVREGIL